MVPISSDIYSSAAVVMDNRSLFDYMQKIEDRRAKREAAEQEAIDKYIDDASKKLTTTGMRAQDVPNFLKMQNDFRQLSNQYKSTKNPYKRLELQKKGDEMFLFIQKSKQADELAKPTREALKNPENRKKLNTEKMMQDLAIHDLPLDFQGVSELGIPSRRDINPNASYYKETPFDFIKTFKEAATGPGIKVSELSVSSDGKTKTITEGFGDSAIKSIASNFVKLVDIDEDKKNYYTIRAKDPQIYPAQKLADYDKKVKQYFPDITVDDEDPLSIALAEAIIEAEGRKSQKFENAPRVSDSTSGRTSIVNLFDYDVLGKYNPQIANIVQPGATAEERVAVPTEIVFEKDIPSEDLELITNKGSVSAIVEKGMKPYFKVRSDGNWEGARGKLIDRSSVARSNLDKTSLTEERRLRQGLIKTTVPKVSAKKGELD
jgi:hypothetical protein